MLPQGFLGTRADILMDIVILSLAGILPIFTSALWLRLVISPWGRVGMGSTALTGITGLELHIRGFVL